MKEKILASATALSVAFGLKGYTRNDICAHAGVSHGAINYHFVSMEGLRYQVVQRAIETEHMRILLEALLEQKYYFRQPLSLTLKRRIATYVLEL